MMIKGVVLDDNMSNLTCASNEASISSSSNRNEIGGATTMYPQSQQSFAISVPNQPLPPPPPPKKKRNLPGNPDPDAEVIALSPKTLMTKNRFICEICSKGFQRDQNLQLHRRGHNLPWKLKQRANKDVIKKKVYVCPEATCVHHDPSRALGDLTGIKKHFSRKHGEKKWKCEKCSKRYAVQSDWKAHSKICGTREYRCDCGTLFSRRDSFITHRAFCDALAEETSRSAITPNPPFLTSQTGPTPTPPPINQLSLQAFPLKREHSSSSSFNPTQDHHHHHLPWLVDPNQGQLAPVDLSSQQQQLFYPRLDQSFMHHQENPNPSPHMSATALLQKAAQMGVTVGGGGGASSGSTKACPSSMSEAMLSGPHQDNHMPTTISSSSSSSSFVHGLPSFGNRASLTHGCMEHPVLLHHQDHDHMVMSNNLSSSNNGGFGGSSSFEEALNGMFNPRPPREGGGGGRGGDGLTRDFLGLRAFPQRGFPNLNNMGGLDQISSSSSYNHHHGQQSQSQQPSWQG